MRPQEELYGKGRTARREASPAQLLGEWAVAGPQLPLFALGPFTMRPTELVE